MSVTAEIADAVDLLEAARDALSDMVGAPTEAEAHMARLRARAFAFEAGRLINPGAIDTLAVGILITHESAVDLMALDAIAETMDPAERYAWAEEALATTAANGSFVYVTRSGSVVVNKLTPAAHGRWISEALPR